jgi:hypothetical protein
MDDVKHTPGPWQVSGVRIKVAPKIGADTRLINVGPDGDHVAMVFFDMDTGRGWNDARLIAAAPDLLAALEALEHEYGPTTLRMAAAAIAKARGQ